MGKTYIPLNDYILIKCDEMASKSKGGIVLPDIAKNPIILTGRVVAISEDIKENDQLGKVHFEELDKVLYNPCQAFPASLDQDNRMYLVNIKNILAVVKEVNNDSSGGDSQLLRDGGLSS